VREEIKVYFKKRRQAKGATILTVEDFCEKQVIAHLFLKKGDEQQAIKN
jgi:hypothetical protein